MPSMTEKIKIDFPDDAIPSGAGSLFLSEMSRQLGRPELLREQLQVKVRNRGASDAEMMLALVYCLAQGEGGLAEVDRLAADPPRQKLLALGAVPDSRRLGEYLFKFDGRSLQALAQIGHSVSAAVAAEVMAQELKEPDTFLAGRGRGEPGLEAATPRDGPNARPSPS